MHRSNWDLKKFFNKENLCLGVLPKIRLAYYISAYKEYFTCKRIEKRKLKKKSGLL